jgi:hypothetical protein
MIVGVSYLLYNWSIQQAKNAGEDLEARSDPQLCADASIMLDGACQNFKSLVANITNIKSTDIDGLLFRAVGLYNDEDNYLQTIESIIKISPGETENVIILKKGTLSQIKVLPTIKKNNKFIYCEDKSVSKEQIKQC